ncbi:MAG: hypothetical protein ACD_55C00117G0003 [uncultured bacterium]|uniref:Glycosyltransferase n=1 Tax=Citrifermentans bemidjiense (strain ATCC BAA-1014 / DSM 16622 / JCM 12645 / Bem) TaxID=404380 RepID=B5EBE2_CITBB|nr:glycosyltransferase family 4 protein [Citrifermentans bemidjiense]ACH40434.1 glycosyltransferase [Citrifermentans bemidjiense Bem]EKD59194.1 MAG: hypothetical protein ACD_55C00117G0003 [uncultured bacterium]
MTATEKDLLFMKLNMSLPVRVLVAIGKLLGRCLPLKNPSALFFFFPFYHVGGAEKVHGAIVRCFSAHSPWVFFTKKSVNNGFLSLFGNKAQLFDIWPLLKYGYPLSVGVMAGVVNRHKDAVVFGSNSLFYSLLVGHLAPSVRVIDLVHAFGGGSEIFTLPVANRLDARVAINGKTVSDLKEQYREAGLPQALAERVVLIENFVDVPANYPVKEQQAQLKLLYVGRGSEEKRVHLVGRIASRCRQLSLPVEVIIVGDALQAVDGADRGACTFLGELADQVELLRIYGEADLLLLTSTREGFPMVIMEAMAQGVVPVSTDVGGIPTHVSSGHNGWLVSAGLSEDGIVEEMVAIVARMCRDREPLNAMSVAAYEYARKNFGGERFCSSYRSLLLAAGGN